MDKDLEFKNDWGGNATRRPQENEKPPVDQDQENANPEPDEDAE